MFSCLVQFILAWTITLILASSPAFAESTIATAASDLNDEMSQDDAARQADIASMKQLILRMLGAPVPIFKIQGTLRVPRDLRIISSTSTFKTTETDASGKDKQVEEIQQEKREDIDLQPVYLVGGVIESTVYQAINDFAKERSYELDNFGDTWPAIKKEADELKGRLDGIVQGQSLQVKKTDKHGDFDFDTVSKGKYMVYSSLDNGDEVIVWMVPVDVINRGVKTIFLDHGSEGYILLYKKGGRGEGSSIVRKKFETGSDLVPPPPPVPMN